MLADRETWQCDPLLRAVSRRATSTRKPSSIGVPHYLRATAASHQTCKSVPPVPLQTLIAGSTLQRPRTTSVFQEPQPVMLFAESINDSSASTLLVNHHMLNRETASSTILPTKRSMSAVEAVRASIRDQTAPGLVFLYDALVWTGMPPDSEPIDDTKQTSSLC